MAAIGVRRGCMRKSEGSINPIAAHRSTIAVNWISMGDTWEVQGHMDDSTAMGWKNFIKNDQTRQRAKRPCTSQREVLTSFKDVDRVIIFCFSEWSKVFTFAIRKKALPLWIALSN